MSPQWQRVLADRIVRAGGADGAWGYRSTSPASAEPTAVACVALAAYGLKPDRWEGGLKWLERVQRPDGGVPVSADVPLPCWATGLALLAWVVSVDLTVAQYDAQIRKATNWLLAMRGHPAPHRPDVYGHDTKLRGWPWVDGTHSWVEPTAYALLGLKAANKNDHPRAREAVKLLWDRSFPNGGWNYGNTRIFGNTLHPFPATTGIALSALAGERPTPRTETAATYLRAELRRIRSPVSLGWGLIGLTAWRGRPADAQDWLAQSASRAIQRDTRPLEESLLLLAGVARGPLTEVSNGDTDAS